MLEIEKKITEMLRQGSVSLTEDLGVFFKDLLSDLKKLSFYQVKRLSYNESYIQDRLIANTISNAENFINDYIEYTKYYSEDFSKILKKYRIPKSVEHEEELKLVMTSFQKDLKEHLLSVAEKAKGLSSNLTFLEEKYKLTEEQLDETKKLVSLLNTISKVDYSSYMSYLLTGKKHKGILP